MWTKRTMNGRWPGSLTESRTHCDGILILFSVAKNQCKKIKENMHARDTYTGNLHYTIKSKTLQHKLSWWDEGCAGKPAQKLFVMLVSLLTGLPSNKEFLVEISGTTVTITCPLTEEPIVWKSAETQVGSSERKYVIENHDSFPANLSCSSGTKKYDLYLNARGE